MYHANTEKEEKINNGRNKQPNQESMRIIEEKENCKDLRILEADTIKQTKMKQKQCHWDQLYKRENL